MHGERDIIERVLAGDTGAFRALVESHQKLVFQFAHNMLRSIEDAEDLTQEVFVAAFRNLAAFDSKRAKISTWLLTIARNRCCNHLKRRRIDTLGDVDTPDRNPLPEDAAVQGEVWRHLSEALDTLPLEQRTAFVLAEIQELPHAEIAAIEGTELRATRNPMRKSAIVGSVRLRYATRQLSGGAFQPLPRSTRCEPDIAPCGSVGVPVPYGPDQSQHQCHTFPAISVNPYPFVANDPTGAV